MSLLRVVYTSVAYCGLSEDDIRQIFETSQKNNSKNDITGYLIYGPGIFLQIIEGEKDRIEKLIEKIKNDPRHSGIELMSKCVTDQRRFKEWTMGKLGENHDQPIICDLDDTPNEQNTTMLQSETKLIKACFQM